MNNELVTIGEYEVLYNAQLAKSCLEENGIKASIVGEDLQSLSPAVGMAWIELQVHKEEAEKAKSILEANRRLSSEAADEQWQNDTDDENDREDA